MATKRIGNVTSFTTGGGTIVDFDAWDLAVPTDFQLGSKHTVLLDFKDPLALDTSTTNRDL